MTGIMRLSRELGSYLGREPIEQPKPAALPRRPNPRAWPPEIRAEMEAIYNEPDPCPPPARKAA